MTNAQSRGWGPGYPNCQTGRIQTLVRRDGLRIPLRQEIIPLVAWLMDETERRGYDIVNGWTWGYACRAIRGYPGVPSNHSWGLAIDINAPRNPMLYGSPGWTALHNSGRTDMPQWLPELWKAHGFTWGGEYSSRQDAMHFEFLMTPSDAARITANLHGTPDKPTPLSLKRTIHLNDQGLDVAYIQDLLNKVYDKWHFLDCRAGTVDGHYGTLSAGAVLHFKQNLYNFETKMAKSHHLTFHKPFDNTCGAIALGALEAWLAAK